jgi:hypothetical protein
MIIETSFNLNLLKMKGQTAILLSAIVKAIYTILAAVLSVHMIICPMCDVEVAMARSSSMKTILI